LSSDRVKLKKQKLRNLGFTQRNLPEEEDNICSTYWNVYMFCVMTVAREKNKFEKHCNIPQTESFTVDLKIVSFLQTDIGAFSPLLDRKAPAPHSASDTSYTESREV